MCWWYWMLSISLILYVFCWLSWEVSQFLSVVGPWSHPFNRVLLATIRDKGLCPCPRCLIPKSKLDQTGSKRDSKFRLKNTCTYLFDCVQIARNAIYKSAAAIAGVIVNQLLKATSSVPTVVSQDLFDLSDSHSFEDLVFIFRMCLLTNLALVLTYRVCLLSTFCMSSNWVSGKPFLPT